MEYRKFGNLGFEVSTFGIGCMRLPLEVQADGTTDPPKLMKKKYKNDSHAIDNGLII